MITLFIPTLNEIEGVKKILPQIKKEWVDEILIIDGNSTDGTREWLTENGYPFVTQKRKGGVGAWWDAFELAKGDIIIPFSPDGNSRVEAITYLVDMMSINDMVIASRYKDGGKSEDDDFLSALANRFFNKLINFLFKTNYTDALVMYKGFRKDLLKKLNITENTGMRFNPWRASMFELIISLRASNLKVLEIPSSEPLRVDGTKDSRAHPNKLAKIYNGFLMLGIIFYEFIHMRG